MVAGTATSDDPAAVFAESIRVIGNPTKAARMFGVSQPTVWRWLKARKWCPAEQVATVSAATGIPKADLRPDLYGTGDLASASTDPHKGSPA